MLDVTVKTLDGINRSFSVPDDMTVRQFKEKIAGSINVTADTQRLIFQGRVLQDEKLLQEYDVQGKVVHVVMRAPPTSGQSSASTESNPSSTTGGRDPSSVFMGSFTLPSSTAPGVGDPNNVFVGSFSLPASILDANMVQNIAQDAIRSMGNLGRNARVATRVSPDGTGVDVHIHLGPVQTGQTTSEAQNRLNTARQMIRLANEAISQFENPDGATSDRQEDASSDTQSAQSPMDTTEATGDAQSTSANTEAQVNSSGNESETARQASSDTAAPSADSPSQPGEQQNAQRRPVRPNISALGEVLVEVQALNRRLQPHMERFQQIVQDDAEMTQEEQTTAQQTCNMVSEVMHSVSHCYHALSDLMVDLSMDRPRQLYVTLAIAHPSTTVIRQTIPVQVSIPVPRSAPSGVSTTSTGTSTTQPATTEASTQPAPTATGTAGVQVSQEQPEDDIERATNEMAAGLENIIQQGLNQGLGTRDNPFVFVEMQPDSMTVNSISAEVVTSSEPTTSSDTGRAPASSTTTETGEAGTTPPTSQPQPSSGTQPSPQTNPQRNQQDLGGLLSPHFIQNLAQQILQQTTGSSPQRMQIHVQQRPPTMMHMGPMGPMGPGFPFRPMMVRTSAPVSESGTQTANARPAHSATQTSTPTSTFGTQTSTTASTASSTSGTQTPGLPRATTLVVPGMPGVQGLNPGVSAADPYLQCSSRHFLTRHARNVLGPNHMNSDSGITEMVGNLMSEFLGAAQGQRATGSTTSTTETPTTSSGPTGPTGSTIQGEGPARGQAPPVGVQIGGMPAFFPGRMPFIPGMTMRMRMGQPRPLSVRTATAPSSRTSASTTSTSAGTSTGTRAPVPGQTTQGESSPEPQFVQMLRSMLQEASSRQNTGGSQTGTSSTTTDQNQNIQTGAQSQPISDEAFTQLVTGITGYMTQAAMGQAPRQTIADFLGNLGENYNMPMGEGFINEGLSCVLAHLQITDLIQVFYGQAQSLNQVQGPLRAFVLTRVLNGAPPFPENIRTSVEKMVEQMEPEIQETVNSVSPRPHIDFHGTLVRFFNQQFNNVVSLIINARDGDPNFGPDLYACIRRLMSELFVLCSRCLGGMPAVQQMVTQRLQSLTGGVNPLVQSWMNSMTHQQLTSFIPTINVSESEVSFYVVYTGQARQAPAQQPSTSTAAASAPSTVKKSDPVSTQPATRPKVTQEKPQPSSLSSETPQKHTEKNESVSSSSQPMDTSPLSSLSEANSGDHESPRPVNRVERPRAPATATSNGLPDSQTVNGEDWRTVVPPDWVPVITQDIDRQRSRPPQAPLSDVYLQGMPSKRRKIMTDDKPNNLASISEAFPDSVRRAVSAASVEPISSMENLATEARTDTDLQQSFDNEVHSSLACRINKDTDYKADRFPNTEDYYHKTDGEKK